MKNGRGAILREIWALVRPYWFGDDRWAGLGLLAVIVALNLGMVYVNVLINEWNNSFYTALQNRDAAAFWHQLLRFSWLAASFIIVAVYQLYLNQMLQIRWRKWLTERYLAHWMEERTYYRLQLADYGSDNPDQRISDDLRMFVAQTLNLSLGLLSSVVTLASFIAILWSLSGVVSFTVGGHEYHLYGSMVIAGVIYAILGTWLTHRVGKPLITLNYEQQRYEADFRYSLVRFRENAEGIALYGGEGDEAESFRQRFAHVVGNWWQIMRRQKRLTWFTAGYNQIAIIYPFVVAAPRYLAGQFSLGQLMQTASAFGHVRSALSFFVDSYTDIADWRAVTQRLTGFRHAIEQAREAAAAGGRLQVQPAGGGRLRLESLHLARPDGEALVRDFNLEVAPGESVLLMGASGTGKSTLFRTVAGIWPFASGALHRPEHARTLFLPQTPYLPIGSLRDVIAYPQASAGVSAEDIAGALRAVGLERLVKDLGVTAHWGQRLSPGEQQRVAFARALVNRPDWLFLDEATSALDEAAERTLYQTLKQALPGAGIVSIGHRASLRAQHDRCIDVVPASVADQPLPGADGAAVEGALALS